MHTIQELLYHFSRQCSGYGFCVHRK